VQLQLFFGPRSVSGTQFGTPLHVGLEWREMVLKTLTAEGKQEASVSQMYRSPSAAA
jgi:hypothetical protein